jgi:hypothetical protein
LFYYCFRLVPYINQTDSITRKMIKDTQQVEQMAKHNLAFFKEHSKFGAVLGRQNDLFATIRQLGKSTMFVS